MKTTMIKSAFILSMMASGGAIALASGKGETSQFSSQFLTEVSDAKKPQTFYGWIQNTLSCPDFVDAHTEHRVELWLDVDANNKLVVLNAKSNSKRLSDFVIKELNGRLCPTANESGMRHFAINFKRIG